MATLSHPGVYVEEVLLPPPVVSDPMAPPQAMLGTHARGPVAWTLVSTWTEFVKLYGGFNEAASTLAIAAYVYFSQQAGNLYVRRVVKADAVTAIVTLADAAVTNTLGVSAANPGLWGNNINVSVVDSAIDPDYFDLIIYYGGTGAGNIVETWSFLDMDPTSERYAPGQVNSLSTYVVLTDAGAGTSPAASANDPLLTGTDGAAPVAADFNSAVTDLDTVPEPLVLGLPGITDVDIINPTIAYADAREDIFVVLDTPPSLSVTNAVAYADSLTQSSYWAMYWPYIQITDPTTKAAAKRVVAPSAGVMGVISRNDLRRSLYTAPAGLTARINGALQPVSTVTDAQAGALNNAHVNLIKSVRGSGTVIFGARTGRRTLQSDRYVPVRRTLIAVKRQTREAVAFALFENNDQALRGNVTAVLSDLLRGVYLNGGLAGATEAEAFYVKCNDSNNPFEKVRVGILTIEIGVALQTPAEFIVITLTQTAGGTTTATTI